MTDYKIWKPEHDGHAPPNWRDGMKGNVDAPNWRVGWAYMVPVEAVGETAEALNSPNGDASEGKPTDPRKSVHEALAILRDYSPDELAKHGITLAPEKDVFVELLQDVRKEWELWGDYRAKELLRTRFEQMKGEG